MMPSVTDRPRPQSLCLFINLERLEMSLAARLWHTCRKVHAGWHPVGLHRPDKRFRYFFPVIEKPCPSAATALCKVVRTQR